MTKTGFGHDNIMGHRVIAGLLAASPCARPTNMPISRPRGIKRQGITFEKSFAKALQARWPKNTLAGQWFFFQDVNGRGHCQTDVLLVFSDEVVIFECKLTDTEKGRSQLSRLYSPVIEKAFGKPAKCIVVTRHLTRETEIKNVTDQLAVAVAYPAQIIPTLHWMERNPL